MINKVSEGSPNIVDAIRAGQIDLVINTPRGGQAHYDGALIRGTALLYGVPIVTTMSAATATVQGIKALRQKPLKVRSLQVHHHIAWRNKKLAAADFEVSGAFCLISVCCFIRITGWWLLPQSSCQRLRAWQLISSMGR